MLAQKVHFLHTIIHKSAKKWSKKKLSEFHKVELQIQLHRFILHIPHIASSMWKAQLIHCKVQNPFNGQTQLTVHGELEASIT